MNVYCMKVVLEADPYGFVVPRRPLLAANPEYVIVRKVILHVRKTL